MMLAGATTYSTSQPVMVEGKGLPAGKYAVFMIPGEKNWTIIFNKQAEQWGPINTTKNRTPCVLP
jgi:hypothetical protein